MKITKISNLYQTVTIEYLFPCVTLLQIIVSNSNNKAFFTESFCPINCYNQCEGVMVWCILITRLLVFYELTFSPIIERIDLCNGFLLFTGYSCFWIVAKYILQMEEQAYQNVAIRLAVTFVIPDTTINPVNLCQACRSKKEYTKKIIK